MRTNFCVVVAALHLVACHHSASAPVAEFGGEYTSATAFFQTLVPSGVSIFLFGEAVGCEEWQQPAYAYQGDYIELDVSADVPGSYNLVDPSALNIGLGEALAYLGSDQVSSVDGSVTLTQVTDGLGVSGSAQVIWNDGETLTIDPFNAAYCPAVSVNFSGSFDVQSAFLDNAAGGSGQAGYTVYLLNQAMDCATWQSATPPLASNTFILEIDVYGTEPATYDVVEAAGVTTGQAAVLDTYGNSTQPPSMDAASGILDVTAVTANTSLAGSLQVTWNDATTLQTGAFTAKYCPLST